eukprot:1146269-Pelagomonas_calceolata.AAC.1
MMTSAMQTAHGSVSLLCALGILRPVTRMLSPPFPVPYFCLLVQRHAVVSLFSAMLAPPAHEYTLA